jgi:hypothetical protein
MRSSSVRFQFRHTNAANLLGKWGVGSAGTALTAGRTDKSSGSCARACENKGKHATIAATRIFIRKFVIGRLSFGLFRIAKPGVLRRRFGGSGKLNGHAANYNRLQAKKQIKKRAIDIGSDRAFN